MFNFFKKNTVGSIENMTLIKCSDVCLKFKWHLQDIKAAGFISSNLHKNGLLGDVMKVYSLYYSMEQALLSTHIHFYNFASYIFQDENGDNRKIKVHVGDIVEIALVENESGYARIEAIFKHHGNDEQDHVFIYVSWFEDVLKQTELLLCPIYRLQKYTNDSWYRVHPISTVKSTPEISFVHNCDSRCTVDHHETSNSEYIRNEFLFTAI